MTYVAMYAALEEEGEIDGWGGSSSLSVLVALVFMFLKDDDSRWSAVRGAADVAWDMGWQGARESIDGDLHLAALEMG